MALVSRIKRLQKLLLNEMASVVEKYGFERKVHGQSFRMPKPFGWAAFHLSFVPHAEIDFDVIANVALRVDAVQELIHQDGNDLSKKEKQATATFGCELGNLSQGKQRRWKIASENDIKPVMASIENALVTTALPYIERYSNLEEMFEVLCRNDRDAWLHSPFHHYRGMNALALAVVLGKQDRVEHIIEESEAFMRSIKDPNLGFFQPFASKVRSLRDQK